MGLYIIGDLHLSLGEDKPMDIFSGWEDYLPRLEAQWRSKITDQDDVILCGDLSWAMSLEGALIDLRFVDGLPGTKWILKGNHDYWWATRKKMETFFEQEKLLTLRVFYNSSFESHGISCCGTRGWLFDESDPQNIKVMNREAVRLQLSLDAIRDKEKPLYVFFHYPPLYRQQFSAPILDTLARYPVERCYYGHLHGAGCANAFEGERNGVQYRLVSADYLQFNPLKII